MARNLRWEKSEIKAVPILEMKNKGKQFELKLDVVQEIFCNVGDHPVAVISVAGALREGKSFILNLLLQHLLKMKRYKEGKIINVFKSRNGADRETVGIQITNKPIMLLDEDDQKVAVFLMDTEGLFDKGRDAKQCSTVFALSCLLSSVQIYNVLRQVQESNLQHLQIFSNYAMATGGKKRKTSAPFQALMFLVRDWAHRDFVCSSKGAEAYLTKFLETDTDENQLVRQQIKHSFSDVKCHLLPRPGDEVESKHGDEILISDITEKFLHGVDNLGEILFKKENLIAKKLNGITITGKGFVNLARTYAEILHTGKMPAAETILNANLQLFLENRTRQLQSEYVKAISEKIAAKYIRPNSLEELHKECLQRVLQQYDEMVDNSEPDEKEKERFATDRVYITQHLETAFQAIQHENNIKKNEQKKHINNCALESGKIYKKELKQAAHGQYLEDVSSPSKKAKETALAAFNLCTQECDEELVEKYIHTFNNAIEAKNSEFMVTNAERKKNLEKDLKQVYFDAVEIHAAMMDKGIEEPGQNVDFVKLKETCFLASVEKFEQSDVGKGYKCRQDEKENLKVKLTGSNDKYWNRFCMYRNTEILNVVKDGEREYKEYVAQFKHETYLEETEIMSQHKRATDAAMKVVKHTHRSETFVKQCGESILEKLTDQLEHMKKRNRLLQNLANYNFREERKALVEELFVKAFEDDQAKYMENDKLQKLLINRKNSAVARYQKLRSSPEVEFIKNEEELLYDIEQKIAKITELNNNNKKKIDGDIDTFCSLLLTDYELKMNEITTDRYANKESLIQLHKKFKCLLIVEMIKAIPYKNILQVAITKCSDELDTKWDTLVEECTKWKSVVGNVKDGAQAGATVGSGIIGVVGAGFAGLAGGIVGGVAGLAKNAMDFKWDLSIQDLPSIKHLHSLNLLDYNFQHTNL